MGAQLLSPVWLFVPSWTVAHQAPLPMDFPGKNTGVRCYFLLQGIFLTQGSNLCLLHLLHWQADCLPLSHLGSPLKVIRGTKTPVLWPPHVKSWLIGKDPDAGRDWGQKEEGTTEDEMAGWHHQLDGHEFEWRWWWTGRPGVLRFMGSQRVWHDWATELNWTENSTEPGFIWPSHLCSQELNVPNSNSPESQKHARQRQC